MQPGSVWHASTVELEQLSCAQIAAVRRDRLARYGIRPVSSDLGDLGVVLSGLAVQTMLSDQVGTPGLTGGLTTMIISRKR